ncbi:MAG: hypothetical protein WBV82_20030 [Myxococcaceae bacterium]
MAKKASTRTVKTWSKEDEKTLVKLIRAGESTSKIARTLKRTEASVRSKAQKESLSLRKAPAPAKAKASKKAGAAKKSRK